MGVGEGAFLSGTFWPATTYVKAGRCDQAEALIEQAEAVAADLGIFAEEVDARGRTFLGNTPLLLAQIEYVRAVLELAKSRPLDRARLLLGHAARRVGRLLGSDG